LSDSKQKKSVIVLAQVGNIMGLNPNTI